MWNIRSMCINGLHQWSYSKCVQHCTAASVGSIKMWDELLQRSWWSAGCISANSSIERSQRPPHSSLRGDVHQHLSFDAHIKHWCKTSFFQKRKSPDSGPRSLSQMQKLVHVFVSSRLDSCNAFLIRIPGKGTQTPQSIQKSTAGVLMRMGKHDHVPFSFHCLPVTQRIHYKLCLLTYQCLCGTSPPT